MGTLTFTTAQRRARLVARHHLARTASDPAAATADLVALHSSDPSTPVLSLWARVPDLALSDIEAALYGDRVLWRLHAMRRTLWIVTIADAPIVMAAASRAVANAERSRLQKVVTTALPDVDPVGWLHHAAGQVRAEMADGRSRTTAELASILPVLQTPLMMGSGRWTTEVALSSRLLFLMAMDGEVVRGPSASWRSSQYRWTATADWFGDPPTPLPLVEEARTALVVRLLARFGPYTTTDLKWWTGWTVRQTRAALDGAQALEVTTDDGPAWILAGDGGLVDDLRAAEHPAAEHPAAEHPAAVHPAAVHPAAEHPVDTERESGAPVVALLPGLDPTTMGWKDRDFYLDPGYVPQLFDTNGNAGPTVWLDGRVIGGWAQRSDGGVVTNLLADNGRDAAGLVAAEADRLTAWLDGTVVTPRFPSPMSRRLMA